MGDDEKIPIQLTRQQAQDAIKAIDFALSEYPSSWTDILERQTKARDAIAMQIDEWDRREPTPLDTA